MVLMNCFNAEKTLLLKLDTRDSKLFLDFIPIKLLPGNFLSFGYNVGPERWINELFRTHRFQIIVLLRYSASHRIGICLLVFPSHMCGQNISLLAQEVKLVLPKRFSNFARKLETS